MSLLDEMLSQQTTQATTMQSQELGQLPNSQFILSNQHVQRPQTLTTSTKAGRAAATARKRPPATKKAPPAKKPRATKKSGNHQSEGTSTSNVPTL
jgi:hypothetical protein